MKEIKVRSAVLAEYIAHAPLPLAMERSIEAAIYRRMAFERPVLDIGCGEGLFAKLVFDSLVDTGIDPDERELARARQLGAHSELIRCRGDDIPKPSGYYKTIFSNSVLEHIPVIEPVFREAYRLLAPGGSFYCTVPSDRFETYTVAYLILRALQLRGLADRYRVFFNRFWRHYHAYSQQKWCELASRNGFRVVDSFAYDPPRTCITNDALVPVSVLGFLTKRLTNRWTWLPKTRKVLLYPLYLLASHHLRHAGQCDDGGLIFLHLTKS